MTLDDGYYAVPDPDDPAVVICWRWSSTGKKRGLRPWSGGAMYGPATQASRGRPARPYTIEVRRAWMDWLSEIRAAIEADPVAAGKLFASITGRCRMCGKVLTDPESVVEGIGPDCGGRR
jgi:hypothetical protein